MARQRQNEQVVSAEHLQTLLDEREIRLCILRYFTGDPEFGGTQDPRR